MWIRTSTNLRGHDYREPSPEERIGWKSFLNPSFRFRLLIFSRKGCDGGLSPSPQFPTPSPPRKLHSANYHFFMLSNSICFLRCVFKPIVADFSPLYILTIHRSFTTKSPLIPNFAEAEENYFPISVSASTPPPV